MKRLLICLLFAACGSITEPPILNEKAVDDEPKTGSITIIFCLVTDTTVVCSDVIPTLDSSLDRRHG